MLLYGLYSLYTESFSFSLWMRIESIYSVHVLHIIVNALLGGERGTLHTHAEHVLIYFLPFVVKRLLCFLLFIWAALPYPVILFFSKRKNMEKKKHNMSSSGTFTTFFSCSTGHWARLCISIAFFYLLFYHHYCPANINPSLNHRVAWCRVGLAPDHQSPIIFPFFSSGFICCLMQTEIKPTTRKERKEK